MLSELPLDLLNYIFRIKSSLELVDLLAKFPTTYDYGGETIDTINSSIACLSKKMILDKSKFYCSNSKRIFNIIKQLTKHIIQDKEYRRPYILYCNQSKEYRASFRYCMDLYASEKQLLDTFAKVNVMQEVD